ncbi:MAG: cell division protein FtsZ [Gammaproteobacteria bacterium]|jgi:cell division protein FtsZ|nr:cell division protein FtsZ [Gammaproteobacteria bacterium]NBR17200.1 cell division protein FtsZ [Gammaproteobacteria bacterium]NCW21226.1 cell division protein FtsZ [Gammaproteobacteria bacterium]NCW56435.1 cell division protein FtsZ [Gammaproteobacteria bacterium]NDA43235.1 cell division protein FtsZ [Gammaproteobacteria bacterium]
MFELMDSYTQSAVIKVLGVGGGGGNAVSHMVQSGIEGVDFMCVNTDAQALKNSNVKTALQIGSNITKGLGAGANPDIGRQAAMEDRDRIIELIEGCDMLFITAGMGGGTGTGAAPVVAQIAKELGILTVAVVTRPFNMEGNKRSLVADHGMEELAKHVDSLITIPNQKLLTVLGPKTTLLDAFKRANGVLQGAVQGIADLITRPGLINVDFADVRTVMSETGMAMMGTGFASGEDRARVAAQMAVSSPLLEDVNLSGARGILVNVTAGLDLGIGEFEEVGNIVKEFASEDATVVVGTVIDPNLSDELRVTVVATGLGRLQAQTVAPQLAPAIAAAPAVAAAPAARASAARSGLEGLRAGRRPVVVPTDYSKLDVPAYERFKAAAGDGLRHEPEGAEEILDIPAFLRRQAD